MQMRLSALLLNVLAVGFIVSMLVACLSAQTESVLYSFNAADPSDGVDPLGGVVLDSHGNIFGTTAGGGSLSGGAVFELTPNTNGTWTEQVIYSFTGALGGTDGDLPWGGLVFDSKGNLYGTTAGGGTSFEGTVFELSPGSNGTWTEKVIHSFSGGNDGYSPEAMTPLVDTAGNLYGTTSRGGVYDFGTVFELTPSTSGTWTETILYSFTGADDGALPYGGQLLLDSQGNLYGSAGSGGAHDYGVIFELTKGTNGSWSESVIYSFQNNRVTGPAGNLVMDTNRNIYGTAFNAFELSPSSDGAWTEKIIHAFSGGTDGATPQAGLIADTNGNLYGTTYTGGAHRGTVFELTPSGSSWKEKVLHRFSASGGDGVFPSYANIAIGPNGRIYGVTSTGGSFGYGAVYEVIP